MTAVEISISINVVNEICDNIPSKVKNNITLNINSIVITGITILDILLTYIEWNNVKPFLFTFKNIG